MKPLNIVFAGTPAFAVPCLEALSSSNHFLKAVYTQPDRPAGRGRKLQVSAVKEWAVNNNVPVHQPLNFKDEQAVSELKELAPDLLVVIAYGIILPRSILSIPHYGCINVHASLLPRWRGASPIQHSLWYGDKKTGITIMQMDAGMDTGDILEQVVCPIERNETSSDLHDKLSLLSISPLLTTLDKIVSNTLVPMPQNNDEATYAPKILKENAHINWHKSAEEIEQQIRAFNPWPICYTQAEEIVRVYQGCINSMDTSQHTPGTILTIAKEGILVATSTKGYLIQELQFPGGKTLSVRDWLNAGRKQLVVGTVLE